MKLSWPVLFLWAAFFFPLAIAEAASPKVITRVPYLIKAPGMYILSGNVAYGGTTEAITVTADDVTIDLRGYVLSAVREKSVGNDTRGVSAIDHKNLTIRNGTIRDFARATFLAGANSANHLIEELHVEQCTHVGIQVSGRNSIIRKNQITDAGGATFNTVHYGIHAIGNSLSIEENSIAKVYQGSNYLIWIEQARGSLVARNLLQNNESGYNEGIHLYGSYEIVIRANEFWQMGYGIRVNSVGGSGVYRDNTFMGIGYGVVFPAGALKNGGGNVP